MRVLVLGMLMGLVVAPSARAAVRLVKDGKSDYVIVLAANPQPANSRAAHELQSHLKQMSGAELAIVDDSKPAPAHSIIVGSNRYLQADKVLGNDGFSLSTSGQKVLIVGPGPRGTMYGVSELLERLGVRWFTPKVTFVPHKPTIDLPDMNVVQIPAFEYREPYFTEAWDKDWAARNRIIGHSPHLDESTGGKISYADFVHSFDRLIPPKLYDKHPEYFPMVGGKRINGYVQRCLTNPDVLKLAIEGVRKAFAANPGAVITTVSQNDTDKWCECPDCTRIAKQYGGQSGLYLWFVNQVADAIEKDLPDKLIDTLAYQYTEAPPTGIKPRPNVRVRLCPIACCEAHPYEHDTMAETQDFMKRLDGWSKITDKLYIWHYCISFPRYLMPFPDFKQFPDSIRLYRDRGVKGVFLEGAYAPGGGGSDAELRSWVMAKLLWNPDLNSDKLVNEWMQGVYGPAAKPMRGYFDLIHEPFKNPNTHLKIYDSKVPRIFTDQMLAQASGLFDEADKLARTDLQREYIARSRLCVRFLDLLNHHDTGPKLDQFVKDCKAMGIQQLDESHSIEHWVQQYREKAQTKKPS